MVDLLTSILQLLCHWDTQIFLTINGWHHPFWDTFMRLYSEKWIWIPFYISFAPVVFRHWKWQTAVTFFVLAIAILIVNDQLSSSLIRPAVARLRPSNLANPVSDVVHIVDGYRGGRYGFPSAHSTNSWGLAMFVILIFRNKRLSISMVLWALLMCYSRLYLGVHYFGDVLVGFLLGSFIAIVFYGLFNRFSHGMCQSLKTPCSALPTPDLISWILALEVALMIIASFIVYLIS